MPPATGKYLFHYIYSFFSQGQPGATLVMAIISVLPHTMPAPKVEATTEPEAEPSFRKAA